MIKFFKNLFNSFDVQPEPESEPENANIVQFIIKNKNGYNLKLKSSDPDKVIEWENIIYRLVRNPAVIFDCDSPVPYLTCTTILRLEEISNIELIYPKKWKEKSPQ